MKPSGQDIRAIDRAAQRFQNGKPKPLTDAQKQKIVSDFKAWVAEECNPVAIRRYGSNSHSGGRITRGEQ